MVTRLLSLTILMCRIKHTNSIYYLQAYLDLLDQFLQVKVIVNLKGREKEFRNNAIELIRRFQNDVGKVCDAALFYYDWVISYL